jgi:hypothetical protein
MKRKPTAQSIRVGQTLYYLIAPLGNPKGRFSVGKLPVLTDALPIPPDGQAGPYPRRFIADHLRRFPGDMHYSRRVVEGMAKRANAERDRRMKLQTELARMISEGFRAALAGFGATLRTQDAAQ